MKYERKLGGSIQIGNKSENKKRGNGQLAVTSSTIG
jgi:hypothetical protein